MATMCMQWLHMWPELLVLLLNIGYILIRISDEVDIVANVVIVSFVDL